MVKVRLGHPISRTVLLSGPYSEVIGTRDAGDTAADWSPRGNLIVFQRSGNDGFQWGLHRPKVLASTAHDHADGTY